MLHHVCCHPSGIAAQPLQHRGRHRKLMGVKCLHMCKHALSTWDLMQPAVQYDTTARSKCRHCRTDQPYLQIKMPHRHRRWLVLHILCSAHDRPLQRQHLICPGRWLMTSCTSVRVSMCEDPCCRQQHALGLRSMVRTQHPGDRDETPSSAATVCNDIALSVPYSFWHGLSKEAFPHPLSARFLPECSSSSRRLSSTPAPGSALACLPHLAGSSGSTTS